MHAKIGDIVVGRGSARVGRAFNLVYWMEINEIIDFDQFDTEPRFADKKPNMGGSTVQRYGDNMYFRDADTGLFRQRDSFHSEEDGVQSQSDIDADTGSTTNVLLGQRFTYFGGCGPAIPENLRSMFTRRNRRCNHPEAQKTEMIAWLDVKHPQGLVGLPTDWSDIGH